MNAIRVRKQIDSETVTIPELKPFIGHSVEIFIAECEPVRPLTPGSVEWRSVMSAVQNLEDYDFRAQLDQDACDLREAVERLK